MYCNEEKLVDKHCLETYGKTCIIAYDAPCFVERLKTNEGFYVFKK